MLAGAKRLDRLYCVEKYRSCDVNGLNRGIGESFIQRCPDARIEWNDEWSGLRGIARYQAVQAAARFGLDSRDTAAGGDVADSDHNPVEHVGKPLRVVRFVERGKKLKAGQGRPSISIFTQSIFKKSRASNSTQHNYFLGAIASFAALATRN